MDHHRHFGYITKLRTKLKALVIEQLTHLFLRVLSTVSWAAANLAKLKLCVIAVVDYLYYYFTGALLVACCSSFVCLVWFCFCFFLFLVFWWGNGSLRNAAAAATDSAVYVGCSTQLAFAVCTHGKCDGLVFFFHLHGYGAAQQQQQGAVWRDRVVLSHAENAG